MRSRSNALGEALQATLSNAVRAPYYRRTFKDRWKSIRSLDDLSRLPILDKRTAIEHQRELVVGEAPAGFGVASSGTTRADVDLPPLNVLTSPEEIEASAAFGPGPGPGPGSEDDGGGGEAEELHPGWTLVAISVTHGLPPSPPGEGELHVPWMYDRNSLYMLETVLGQPQPDGRRVTAMRLSVGALKVFTAWLLERGKDPSAFGVKLIGTNSFRLSPFWRELIERKFDAEVFDNYSLSEFATPATECKDCGWMHFGWPPLIYEVLDLASGERKDRGVGRLVLTGVHPFVQKMPLIRYDTGDVVELGPRCRVTGSTGLRYLGRARRGLIVHDRGEGAYVLAPTLVQDVLEALPETERNAHPFITLGYIKTKDIGLPRWTVDRDGDVARLRFEVRFDPHIFEARSRELAERVRKELLALDAPLRKLVRRRVLALEVECVAARSLVPPPDKYD